MKIEYVGKTLLIEHESEKILVIGDLHLGFEESLRESGIMLPLNIFDEIVKDFDRIFESVGKVDRAVLLGDVKHEFIKFGQDAWKEIGEVFNYLRRNVKEVIVIKGNHDVVIESIVRGLKRVRLVDYYLLRDTVFLHGDRDFPEIHDKQIKTWVIAHGHPAITVYEKDGSKKERYKCFLEGKYKGKKIIVVPSFSSVRAGTDVLGDYDLGFPWDFNLNRFNALVVQDDSLDVLDFGELRKL